MEHGCPSHSSIFGPSDRRETGAKTALGPSVFPKDIQIWPNIKCILHLLSLPHSIDYEFIDAFTPIGQVEFSPELPLFGLSVASPPAVLASAKGQRHIHHHYRLP
jgi:hypothetical protein